MADDPYMHWSEKAKGLRPLLEPLLLRHSIFQYASHPDNCRSNFGWPMGNGTKRNHILALGEDEEDNKRILFRLTVGDDHDLFYPGSPYFKSRTKNSKDENERVDCYIPYRGGLPERFEEAVDMAFNFMLQGNLAGYRDAEPNPPKQPKAFDVAKPPPRVKYHVSRIVRDTATAIAVKRACNNSCQLCGATLMLGDQAYSEAHHLHPLGDPYQGFDIPENLVSVCPNCHAKLDYGAVRIVLEELFHLDLHHPSAKYVNYHNETMHDRKGKID